MTKNPSKAALDGDTYWVVEPEQLQCLASPVRGDIIDHLVGRGPMAIKQIASSLGRQPSSIYYHIEKLLEVGLIEEAGRQVVNRRTEILYKTPGKKMRVKKALADMANRDVITQTAFGLLRQSQRDFERGYERASMKIDGDERNMGFFRLVNRPSPESLAEINGYLERIAEILWQERDESQPLVAFAWTMAPLDDGAEDG